MSLIAFVAPILPGKRDQWDAFIAEIAGPRRSEFNASRQPQAFTSGHFLQETPMGDVVIVTLEGDNPMASTSAPSPTLTTTSPTGSSSRCRRSTASIYANLRSILRISLIDSETATTT